MLYAITQFGLLVLMLVIALIEWNRTERKHPHQ
jgi:hypothetical protein